MSAGNPAALFKKLEFGVDEYRSAIHAVLARRMAHEPERMMTPQLKRNLSGFVNRFERFYQPIYLSYGSGVQCPICRWTGRAFVKRSAPNKPADSFICPSCRSSERHRLAYFVLKDRLPNYAEKTLHFAPESCIEPWLRTISKEYLSVDLSSKAAMEHMDITDLRLPDDTFSLLWCSHVLEHIENDRKAMAELFRVLRPSGLAVIMVPVYGETTYENPEVKSPAERLKHFRQADHVRLYGVDIKTRLQETGFKVDVRRVSDLALESVNTHLLNYPSTKELFLCIKP